jgi:hypothetical protein
MLLSTSNFHDNMGGVWKFHWNRLKILVRTSSILIIIDCGEALN